MRSHYQYVTDRIVSMTSQYLVTLSLTTALSLMPTRRVLNYKQSDCVNKMDPTLRESSKLLRTTRTVLQVMRASISNIAETSTRFKSKQFYVKPLMAFGNYHQTTSHSPYGLPRPIFPVDSTVGPSVRRKLFTYYTPSLVKGVVRGYTVTIEQHTVHKFPQDMSTSKMVLSPSSGPTASTSLLSALEQLQDEEGYKGIDQSDLSSLKRKSKVEIFPEPSPPVSSNHISAMEEVTAWKGHKAVEQNDECNPKEEPKLEPFSTPNASLSAHQPPFLEETVAGEVLSSQHDVNKLLRDVADSKHDSKQVQSPTAILGAQSVNTIKVIKRSPEKDSKLELYRLPSPPVQSNHQLAMDKIACRAKYTIVQQNHAFNTEQESKQDSCPEPNAMLSTQQPSCLEETAAGEVPLNHVSHHEGFVSAGGSSNSSQISRMSPLKQSQTIHTSDTSFLEGVACSGVSTTTGQHEVIKVPQSEFSSRQDSKQEQEQSVVDAQSVNITEVRRRRPRPRRSLLNTNRKMFMTSKSSGLQEQPESDTTSHEPRPEPAEQLSSELIVQAFGYDAVKYPFWMVDTKFPLPNDITDVELPCINRRLIDFRKNEEGEFNTFATGTADIFHASKDGNDVLVKDFTNCSKSSEQVLNECRIMSLLAATSITPRLQGAVEQGFGQEYFIVMDKCEGFVSLTKLLSSGLYVPKPSWVKICVSLASHVKILHHHKILHNNISTDNVLVHKDTLEVKLVGFGSASYNKGIQLPSAVDDRSVISPEVKLGCYTSTESDVYALGSVLEKLMTESRALDLHKVVNKTHQELPKDRPRAEEVHSMVLDILNELY